jgi:hypothetical protein
MKYVSNIENHDQRDISRKVYAMCGTAAVPAKIHGAIVSRLR